MEPMEAGHRLLQNLPIARHLPQRPRLVFPQRLQQNRHGLSRDQLVRADGQNIDCILHVNPRLKTKGLAMMFNPTERELTQTIRLPLYYTGLTKGADLQQENGPVNRRELDEQRAVDVEVQLRPRGVTW